MGIFVRKVPTASGATAVQVVHKRGRHIISLEHVGSAHSKEDLLILLSKAEQIKNKDQMTLFSDNTLQMVQDNPPTQALVLSSFSELLWNQLELWWSYLGFDCVTDEVFKQVVLARIVEPVSKLDTIRVLENLGITPPSESAIYRSLRRSYEDNYRQILADACWERVSAKGPVSLLLYDVTTLYFEAQKEDSLRKSGFSKERRIDPQIIVGLLVDRSGYPLMVHEFAGNKSETLTIIPVIKQFAEKRNLPKLTVVADAAMLSRKNLEALQEQGFDFIVGSRISKVPYEIKEMISSDSPPTDLQTLCQEVFFGSCERTLIRVLKNSSPSSLANPGIYMDSNSKTSLTTGYKVLELL